MKKINPSEVNVYAYLAPHPLEEDSFIEPEELDWIPGFNAIEIGENGEHPLFREENIEIYNKIESTTVEHFRKGLNNLWPLLNEHMIDHMQIAIDLTGIISSKSSLAGYNFDRSSPAKGKYVFHLDQGLMVKYVEVLNNLSTLGFRTSTTWEHELIHLLDHWEIVKSSTYRESNSIDENFKHFLMKYREEGIAELYFLLNGGYDDVKSIDEAKDAFRNHVKQTREKIVASELNNEKLRNEIFSGFEFYEVGPWLILDMLKTFEGGWQSENIEQAIHKICSKEVIEKEKILDIIKIALRIKSNEFLYYTDTLSRPI